MYNFSILTFSDSLLGILHQARSKAYGHAARYYKQLDALASHIDDYQPLLDHRAFLIQLKQEHGLKRSFWSRVSEK